MHNRSFTQIWRQAQKDEKTKLVKRIGLCKRLLSKIANQESPVSESNKKIIAYSLQIDMSILFPREPFTQCDYANPAHMVDQNTQAVRI